LFRRCWRGCRYRGRCFEVVQGGSSNGYVVSVLSPSPPASNVQRAHADPFTSSHTGQFTLSLIAGQIGKQYPLLPGLIRPGPFPLRLHDPCLHILSSSHIKTMAPTSASRWAPDTMACSPNTSSSPSLVSSESLSTSRSKKMSRIPLLSSSNLGHTRLTYPSSFFSESTQHAPLRRSLRLECAFRQREFQCPPSRPERRCARDWRRFYLRSSSLSLPYSSSYCPSSLTRIICLPPVCSPERCQHRRHLVLE
jgi:hypothetical protein